MLFWIKIPPIDFEYLMKLVYFLSGKILAFVSWVADNLLYLIEFDSIKVSTYLWDPSNIEFTKISYIDLNRSSLIYYRLCSIMYIFYRK